MTRKARRAVKQMTNKPYDISKIYADMEIDLIKSMQRNLKRHLAEEEAYGFQWEQWQSMKLRELAQYRKEADKTIQEYGGKAKREARAYTEQSFLSGGAGTNAFYSRFRPELAFDEALFFGINRRLVDTLTASVQNDLARAEHAVLRMTDDVYRKTIFKSQMYYNMGAANLWQAVDMATADFLGKGYNAVVYKNGNRVNIASYAEMAIRTTAKRASLSGAGARQNELGERLCYIPGRGMACELCVPWLSRVYIDDVYAGGKPADGPYPLLSTAIAGGIFHPNCRDGRYPYYKGVTNAPKPLTDEEKELSVERYEQEQKQRYMERNVRKYKRLEAGSLSPENKGKYGDKVRQWQERLRSQTKENDFLRRNYAREAIGKRASANIRLQNAGRSGIITPRGGKIMNHIQNIDSPIEQRNTAKGNPNAIMQFGRPLNNRQQTLLDQLPQYDSRTTVKKKSVKMSDLSALTAQTGDEFAMFTKGKERLIIRGNAYNVNVDEAFAKELSRLGYKWSGHTHPGTSGNVLIPSVGDKLILKEFNQEQSVIYDSRGTFGVFFKE